MSHNTESIFKAFDRYGPGAYLRDVQSKEKVNILHRKAAAQNRKEGVYNPPANTAGLSSWTEEDRQRQLKARQTGASASLAAPYGRDQSEDRKAPKFLVEARESRRQDGSVVYWVVRASDRRSWDGPYQAAGEAVDKAIQREWEYA